MREGQNRGEPVRSVDRSGVKQVARHGSRLCSFHSPGAAAFPAAEATRREDTCCAVVPQPAPSEGSAALAQEPHP